MNCSRCGKPIILQPSATERARRYGGKPSDYTKLFTMHSECQVEARKEETLELIRRIKRESEESKVSFRV